MNKTSKAFSILLIIFLFQFNSYLLSQTPVFDSLKNILNESKIDTNTVDLLNTLALKYKSIDLVKAKHYSKQAISIAEQLNYKNGLAYGLYNLGTNFWRSDVFDSALFACNQALILFDELNNYDGKILCYNRIAITNMYRGQFELAIDYYYKALDLCEQSQNSKHIGMVYHNIAAIYSNLNDYLKAKEYLLKAIDHKRSINNPISLGVSLNDIARQYLRLDSIELAEKYSRISLAHNLPLKNNYSISGTYQTIAGIFDKKLNYDSAYVYYEKAMEFAKIYGNKRREGFTNYLLGRHYLLQGRYEKAIYHGEKALDIIESTENSNHIIYTCEVLHEAYGKTNKFKKAYEIAEKLNALNAKLNKKEHLKRLAIEEKEFAFKLKQQAILYEQEAAEAHRKVLRNYYIFAIVVLVLILLLISFVLYQKISANRFLRKANDTRDKMFKIISHDLRSPLISISSSMQLIPSLIKQENPDSLIAFGKENEKSITRVLQLIDNLINWTLSQNNSIPYFPTVNNLVEVIDSLFDIYKPMARFKKVELINKVETKVLLYCDVDILKTVLRNLINNAIKFTLANGTIEISAQIEGYTAIIKIRDTGVGMEKGFVENAFSLNKESLTGTGGEKGNGLGLFFSKEFVEKNHGKIWIESEVGKGTEVFFTVPIKMAQ